MLEDLKAYLSSLPLLSPSKPGEELFLYLAVSLIAIIVTLVKEENGVHKLCTSQAEHSKEQKRDALDGKAHFCISNCGAKAQAIFPGTHCDCPNGQAPTKSNE